MTDQKKPPNPGSNAALKLGCRCAVMDNNHGKWSPYPPDGWWISENCPLHAPKGSIPREPGIEDLFRPR